MGPAIYSVKGEENLILFHGALFALTIITLILFSAGLHF
jgi:hypothetical protein